MSLRAVIFDLHGTLLETGPPPDDAAEQWHRLWQVMFFGPTPRLTLQEFATQCGQAIARAHALKRATGVPHPEVFWPDIVGEVLPELARLTPEARDEFLFQQLRLRQTIRLMPGAADVLRQLTRTGVLLGLASNCQPCSLRAFDVALQSVGLARNLFSADLCFFSFEHGFSKPDPEVYRWLGARLRALGVRPSETLMVGDRPDDDVIPPQAQGWQTWHLTTQPAPGESTAGDWRALSARLTEWLSRPDKT